MGIRSLIGCSIPGCKSKIIDVVYLGRFRLCERCWNKYAAKEVSVLKKKLGLPIEEKPILSPPVVL